MEEGREGKGLGNTALGSGRGVAAFCAKRFSPAGQGGQEGGFPSRGERDSLGRMRLQKELSPPASSPQQTPAGWAAGDTHPSLITEQILSPPAKLWWRFGSFSQKALNSLCL